MIASLTLGLSIVVASAQEEKWTPFRLGETGLRITLPKEPKISKLESGFALTLEHESINLKVVAQPDTSSTRPLPSALYMARYQEFQAQYDKKIKSILNESPVLEANMFQAEESIGFVLEIAESGGLAVGWQYVRIDGWRYTIDIKSSRSQQPLLERILGSVVYVDPATGDFPVRELGVLGLKSLLGHAFLPDTAVPVERATSLLLQGENLPIVASAGMFSPSELDSSTPEKLKEGIGRWFGKTAQGDSVSIDLTPVEREGAKAYQLDGTIRKSGLTLKMTGIALVRPELTRVVIIWLDGSEDGMALAQRIVRTVELTESAKAGGN
ncbi:hypothetical protein QPK87_28400 [Kamptonema cortianum]|nr:hypothetical protein [Geitlerinema splendidum]MDK3160448.1 hypothetical protein [Kamptonema cortianum]